MTASDLEGLAMQASLERKLFGVQMPHLKIGRFFVLRRLGQGGMGLVFAVYDDRLDRRVALKLLKGDASPSLRERLAREAKAMARLSHPNVVPVFEVDEHDGQLFIVMEYVRGTTLRAWLDHEPRTVDEVLDKYIQAGRGLAAAHVESIVHRDFKPDNAVVGPLGRVQVLDFGLSRSRAELGPDSMSQREDLPVPSDSLPAGNLDTPLTETGTMVGTPAYMAPEQWRGNVPGHRADQFSFCVSLWEALGGARPFAGTTRAELSVEVTDGTLRLPPKAIPIRVRRVLERGLAVDPEERFASMPTLLAALERAAGRRTWVRPAVLGLVIAGAVGVAAAAAGSSDDPCVDGPADLATVWDQARRERIAAALSSVPMPFAADTAQRVDAALTTYAQAWLQQRRDACEATRVRHDQSSEVMEQRMRCLADRKRRLDAAATVLEAPDADVLVNATATARLPDVERCGDLAYVAADALPLTDPEAEAERERLLGALARAEALQRAGRYDDALAVAAPALEGAQALNHASTTVHAANDVSEILFSLGRRQDAGVAARQGFVVADDAASRLAAMNLLALAHALMMDSRFADAVTLCQRAAKLAQRAREPRSVQALAYFRMGEALRGTSDHDEALQAFETARGLAEPGDVMVARLDQEIGAVFEAKGEYDEALAYSLRAIDALRESLGQNHPHVAGAMVATGIKLWRLDRNEEARAQYEQALKIQRAVYGQGHPQIATTLHNDGLSLVREGKYAPAIERYQEALAIWEKSLGADHLNVAAAHDSLGLAYQNLSEYEKAREHHAAALAIQVGVRGDDHVEVAGVRGHLAQALVGLGRYDEAVEQSERTLTIEAKAYGDHPYVASDHNALSELYAALGRLDDARAQSRAAIQMWERIDPQRSNAGWAHLGLGYAEAEAGDCHAALPHLQRAWALFAGMEADRPDRARPAAALAICAHRAGRDDLAETARDELRRIAALPAVPPFVPALQRLVHAVVADDAEAIARARDPLRALGLRPFTTF